VAIYTSAKALSRWPINDESTLTHEAMDGEKARIIAKESTHDP
jgi:hypothetical protein